MGIDNPCETQKRHDLGANIRAIAEPVVVKKDPEGKNCVQVSVVCPYDPVALAEVETFANQDHRLFAGGQGSNASFGMVEIVEFLLNVDERIALRNAVEEDSSRWEFACLFNGYRQSALGANCDRGRLHAGEHSCFAVLSDVITSRKRWHPVPRQARSVKRFGS